MAFNRQYKISFGVPVRSYTDYIRVDSTGTPLVVRTLPSDARVLIGDSNNSLQIEMTASYKKGQGKKPDGTVLKITNMSSDDRALMERKNAVCVVEAGYEDEGPLPDIYSGDIKKVYTDQVGENVITTIIIEDGYAAKTSARISKNYAKGSTVSSIIDDLIDSMPDVGRGQINLATVLAEVMTAGFSVHGYIGNKLTELCKSYNLDWNISNGVINVHKDVLNKGTQEYSNLLSRAFSVQPKHIKGSVQRMRDNNKKKPSQNLDRTALKLNMFLNGNIKVGNLLQLNGFATTTSLNGIYQVSSVRHTLNYRGGEWTTLVETVKVGG